MNRADFHFDLPEELIAHFPPEERSGSRLLHLNGKTGQLEDRAFTDLIDLLNPNDCLIFNNTKVVAARLLGKRESGGKVELLVERVLNDSQFLSQVKSSNRLKTGSIIVVGDHQLVVLGRQEPFYKLELQSQSCSVFELMQSCGHIPLPPYIQREDSEFDVERYQTVYAEKEGAVAAPTAGLHFSTELMSQLQSSKIHFGFVTLHVGSGTFSPIRVDNILEHKMHSERYEIPQQTVDLIRQTKEKGGRVIAVGTTSVRCLESASRDNPLTATEGETDIFIYPGYSFNSVDALITNFHLPESTLIMLVSAFAGTEQTLNAYRHAVKKRYRFFSYGDAMFIEKNDA